MSLLMEALRKAEEAKRRMQQEDQQAASGMDLRDILENFTGNPDADGAANVPGGVTAAATVPTTEPEFQMSAPEREPSARALARRQQRSAAGAVFVAKQNPARNRKTLTLLVIVMVMMIPVGGGVLWYLQAASRTSIGIDPAIAAYDLSRRGFVDEPPEPQVAETAQQLAANETTIAETVTAPVAITETVIAEDSPAVSRPEENAALPPPLSAQETTAATTPQSSSSPATANVATAESAPGLPETTTAAVLEISRSGGTRQIRPGLSAAYASLQAGDFGAAGAQYQKVLDNTPNSRDALLGLGLVHLRQGQLAAARELYARALQLNPRDPLAHTGLLQTMQGINPTEHESTLRTLLSQYPEVAQLSLALGNLYAAQQRWSEAQGAYYNALLIANRSSGGPVHPDYAFNLAVSLEQLNQGKAAVDYYRQAQTLAREVTPGFDPQLLNDRLDFLQGQGQDQP